MEYQAKDNLEIMKFARNYNNFIVNLILKVIKKSSYKKVIDFGCSDGFFINLITDKVPEIKIVGVDSDINYLNNNKDFVVFSDLDEIKEEFDFIYSLNTLEHIYEDVEILKKINSKLKNNGKIFLYLPAFNWLYSSMDKKTGHYRRYDKKMIINKLELSGFSVDKIEYCDFLGIFATLIYIFKDYIKNNNGNINRLQIELYDKIFYLSRFFDMFFSFFCGKNLFVIASKK